jgi:hypothetical protein
MEREALTIVSFVVIYLQLFSAVSQQGGLLWVSGHFNVA